MYTHICWFCVAAAQIYFVCLFEIKFIILINESKDRTNEKVIQEFTPNRDLIIFVYKLEVQFKNFNPLLNGIKLWFKIKNLSAIG